MGWGVSRGLCEIACDVKREDGGRNCRCSCEVEYGVDAMPDSARMLSQLHQNRPLRAKLEVNNERSASAVGRFCFAYQESIPLHTPTHKNET